ncbi:MAG: ZIP family metal transporter [Vicingaceae bacterium]
MILFLSLFMVSLLGGSLVFIKQDWKRFTNMALAFSGAYLLGICLLHLIPELFESETAEAHLGAFILIGYLLQLVLDYFSGGIEHGHVHVNKSFLGRFPWLIMISLCVHALVEAFPLHELNNQVGISSYLMGLLLHKVPISFILVSLLMGYKLPNYQILLATLLFAAMGPLGVSLGQQLGHSPEMFSRLLALSIGIILHLSTTILLESNEDHRIHWKKLIPVFVGFGLAFLSLGEH